MSISEMTESSLKKFPGKGEVEKRLADVHGLNEEVTEVLHPILANALADKELDPRGVAFAFKQAYQDLSDHDVKVDAGLMQVMALAYFPAIIHNDPDFVNLVRTEFEDLNGN